MTLAPRLGAAGALAPRPPSRPCRTAGGARPCRCRLRRTMPLAGHADERVQDSDSRSGCDQHAPNALSARPSA